MMIFVNSFLLENLAIFLIANLVEFALIRVLLTCGTQLRVESNRMPNTLICFELVTIWAPTDIEIVGGDVLLNRQSSVLF